MGPIYGIIKLTWKAAFRYRLFLVAAALLIGAVVLLPMLIKDDGTARGFTQILLTYTLSAITLLLGFATLWLSCGVLASDIEGCQLQMVAVKPIPRWQIWLGKWLGVVTLDAALLGLAGGAVYGLLMYRAGQLPENQQDVLRREVFVARGSLTEPVPDLQPVIDAELASRVGAVNTNDMDFQFVRQQLEAAIKANYQIVRPGYVRNWSIPVGLAGNVIGNEPIFLRFRFYGTDTNALAEQLCEWRVGTEAKNVKSFQKRVAANTFHEERVDLRSLGPDTTINDLLDEDGNLSVQFTNRDESAVVFPLEDGLEVLYREGSFGLNYIRGLLIILFWLSLLAALGLAAASYMSFPVACFVTLGMLLVALSSGTIAMTVAEGSIMGWNRATGQPISRTFDLVLMPVFRLILWLVTIVQGFSPVENLSSGRSITWWTLLRAFTQIVVILGGLFAAAGMILLNRRELATAPSNQ